MSEAFMQPIDPKHLQVGMCGVTPVGVFGPARECVLRKIYSDTNGLGQLYRCRLFIQSLNFEIDFAIAAVEWSNE
jgi:hypothetical protein